MLSPVVKCAGTAAQRAGSLINQHSGRSYCHMAGRAIELFRGGENCRYRCTCGRRIEKINLYPSRGGSIDGAKAGFAVARFQVATNCSALVRSLG